MKTPIFYFIEDKNELIKNPKLNNIPNYYRDLDHKDVCRYLPPQIEMDDIHLAAKTKNVKEATKGLEFILNKFETYECDIVNNLLRIRLTKQSLLNYQKHMLHQSIMTAESIVAKNNINALNISDLKMQLYGYETPEQEPFFYALGRDVLHSPTNIVVNDTQTVFSMSEWIYILSRYFDKNPDATYTFYLAKDDVGYFEYKVMN